MDRFKLMETYAAVVRLGSYTRAAGDLGVTRAMVSRRVQELEALLGARLLNRNTHGIAVTGIGAEYYEDCATLLSRLKDVEERTRADQSAPSGDLRIYATKTFGEVVLGSVVADFCALYPDINVQVRLGATGDVRLPPGFDLAIRTLRDQDADLVSRPIIGLPRILVAAPQYLVVRGTPRSPADLATHNCLDPSGAAWSTWEFQGKGGRTSIRVGGSPQLNTSLMVKHAVLKGLGIGILREFLVSEEIRAGRLVRVLGHLTLDRRMLHIFRAKDRDPPLRMRLFADYLCDRMKHYAKELGLPAA